MREIKFRGKSTVFGKGWRYGYLTVAVGGKGKWFKITNPNAPNCYDPEVDPETVGEFTGFKDIDDKEIFEGDIIQNDEHPEEVGKIINENGCWLVDWVDDDTKPCLGWLLDNTPQKVIGNIFDNPELLEVGNDG